MKKIKCAVFLGIFLLVLCFSPSLAQAAPTLLHTASINVSTNGSHIASFTVPATAAGSLMVAWVSSGSSLTGSSISDATNGTWSPAISGAQICSQYDSFNCGAFYFCNSGSGVTTVTLNAPAQSFNGNTIVYAEYSGIAASSCLDQSSILGSWTSSGTWSSSSVTTTQANELLLGLVWNQSTATLTGANGFTNEVSAQNFNPFTIGIEDRTVSSIGSYTAQGTFDVGGAEGAILTFKPTGITSDTQAPSTPTNLSATAVSSSGINLSWTASTDNLEGVTGYKIYRGGVQVGTTVNNNYNYNDNSLIASTQYTYTVSAYDAAGNNSSQSSSATATTQAAAGDTTPPSAPTNLSATAVSSSAINLSWTASTDNVGVTGYKIYRGGVQIGTTITNNYNDNGLSASTAYTYTVSAYDAAGNNSSQSSSASATTQANAGASGNIYIAQNATGSNNGSSCANAYAVSFFNTSSNWGNGTGKISPGTTVHLCGTITSQLVGQGSGTSGSPITIYFEPNAKISMPAGTLMNMQNENYIVIDGGTNGILENTDNGTNLDNQIAASGIYASGSGNLEIKNLTIQNLYVHTSTSDAIIDEGVSGGI